MSFLLGILCAGIGIGEGIMTHDVQGWAWATAAAVWTTSAYRERQRADRFKAQLEAAK